ncbi:hypothetical protein ACCO45_005491 [Purpureocillium lilacinum]|uniref:Uncharacterized protein n=1 Tax=Purpureocillium lilacinum TaxID=33203 RepID=A0ACC4DXW6_PURLI
MPLGVGVGVGAIVDESNPAQAARLSTARAAATAGCRPPCEVLVRVEVLVPPQVPPQALVASKQGGCLAPKFTEHPGIGTLVLFTQGTRPSRFICQRGLGTFLGARELQYLALRGTGYLCKSPVQVTAPREALHHTFHRNLTTTWLPQARQARGRHGLVPAASKLPGPMTPRRRRVALHRLETLLRPPPSPLPASRSAVGDDRARAIGKQLTLRAQSWPVALRTRQPQRHRHQQSETNPGAHLARARAGTAPAPPPAPLPREGGPGPGDQHQHHHPHQHQHQHKRQRRCRRRRHFPTSSAALADRRPRQRLHHSPLQLMPPVARPEGTPAPSAVDVSTLEAPKAQSHK